MSVIARKIAIANEPTVNRPDEACLADEIIRTITPIFRHWLSIEELELECVSVEWNTLGEDRLSDMLVACRGQRSTQQAAISANSPLANFAVQSLLRMDSAVDGDALAALRPFALQNLVALGERLNATPFIESASETPPQWSAVEAPTLMDNLDPHDVLNLELVLQGPNLEGLGLRLLMTSDLLVEEEDNAEIEDGSEQPQLSPRLGPCHVQVRAVGDRVSLSVADCTRLEIGQIVALPGLRFDRLDLDVEMEDGPVRLTDAALGADKGRKAVRLNRGLDPAFREKPDVLSEAVPE